MIRPAPSYATTSHLSFYLVWTVLACLAGPNIIWAQDETPGDLSLESMLEIEIDAASKHKQTVREAPASITVISAEEIERFGYRTLADVLESVRGFYTRYDRNYAYAGVRGFSRPGDADNRLLVLFDGQTTNEYVFGAPYLGTDLGLDLGAIERIEVIRGPGSALYGSSAMFAVINIVPKKAEALQRLQVGAELGSYGQREATASFGKTFADNVGVTVSGIWGDVQGPDLYFEEFDDPSTNNGFAEHKDWDQYYGGAGILSYGLLRVQARYSQRKKGIPTGAWETIFNGEDAWTWDRRASVEARFEHALSPDKNLLLRGYTDHNQYLGFYPYLDDDEIVDSFDEATDFWTGGEAQFRWDMSSANRLIVGSEFQKHFRTQYRLWDDYDTYTDFDTPFTAYSLYVQDAYQMTPKLAFILGLRHDRYSTTTSATTPRAALTYHFSGASTLKVLYGEAFRTPNVFELNYDDPFSGYKPSPNLKPERIHTFEIVGEHQFDPLFSAAVSLYHYRVHNLIDQDVDPVDSLIYNLNLGAVQAMGAEVEFNARTPSGLIGYASYTFQHARTRDAQEHLSNSPEHLAKAGLTTPVLPRLYAAAAFRYESERLTVYETHTDAFLRVDLTLSTTPLFDHLRLSLQIRNVFDEGYALPGGFEHQQNALRQDGRTLAIKALYHL